MAHNIPTTNLVIYKLKQDTEKQFLPLLKAHYPSLKRMGLATDMVPKFWRGTSRDGSLSYVEIFQWVDVKAPEVAHQTPEVMQIWEPMGPMLANLEFINIEECQL